MNYEAVYQRLIRFAQIRRPLSRGYYERHHIVPKCIGGSDVSANLVWLTPEEHYVAHQLLVKLHPGNSKLLWAALAMTGSGRGNGRAGNKLYGWLRRRFVEGQTGKPRWDDAMKQRIGRASKARNQGESHPMYGRRHSEETKARMSAQRKGKSTGPCTFSPEHCANISKARKKFFARGGAVNFKGCQHSEETKQRMRGPREKRAE